MYHYVYILKTADGYIKKTYVGYSMLLPLKKHNSSKGAKSTKGYKWKVIYKKDFCQNLKHHSNINSKKIEKKGYPY